MSNRHLARTLVLQALFQWDFNGQKENIYQVLESNKNEFAPDFDDQGFSEKLSGEVTKKIKELNGLITRYAPEWPLEQITTIDRNVLRIGIYELKYAADIPPKVAINEAIELAKKYGGESSGKFVNGVLGSVFKDMQTAGEKKDFENEMAREFSAGGVIFRKEKEGYLFAIVLDAYNKWTFPKGHIEENENQEEAAKREITEEIGIKNLVNHGFLGSIDIKINTPNKRPVPKTVYYYLMETDEKNLTVAEPEIKEARWLNQTAALQTIGYENAKEIFKAALKKLNI